MSAPRLKLSQAAIDALQDGGPDQPRAVAAVGKAIAQALRQAPHFVVLTGLAPTEDRAITVALARRIANFDPVRADLPPDRRDKVSFTRVKINPDRAVSNGASTAYSRTNQPLELHTDSSYKAEPHELVAFQFVRADADGGDTLMMAVEDVVGALPEDTRQALAKPIFPFGKGAQPVLWQRDGADHIRYYRSQIDSTTGDGEGVVPEARAAMDALDGVLVREDLQHRFHVHSGETIFMHNTRVLHGRTGFAPTSDRLMYRIRVHAGCLG